MPTPLEEVLKRLRDALEQSRTVRAALAEKNQSDSSGQGKKLHELRSRIASEFLMRGAVDSACRKWISDGDWPKMEDEFAIHCWDRVFHGFHLAEWLYRNGFQTGLDEGDLLSLLVVSSWPTFGLKSLQASLQSLPQ